MALVFTLLCQHANERLHIMIDNDVDVASAYEISHLGERQVLPEKLDKMPGVLRLSTCTEHLRNERVGSGAALWESFLPYGDELRRERESERARDGGLSWMGWKRIKPPSVPNPLLSASSPPSPQHRCPCPLSPCPPPKTQQILLLCPHPESQRAGYSGQPLPLPMRQKNRRSKLRESPHSKRRARLGCRFSAV